MSAPGAGFDATPAAIDGAAAQLARTRDAVRAFSDGLTAGIATAGGVAGEGPLSGALTALADGTRQHAEELGDETDELAQALRESVEAYRASDGPVSFAERLRAAGEAAADAARTVAGAQQAAAGGWTGAAHDAFDGAAARTGARVGSLARLADAAQRLAPRLDAIRDPCGGTLQLSYAGRAMDGWRGAEVVALLLPADDTGHHTLVGVLPARLSAAPVKVAALTERPRAPAPVPADALRGARGTVRWWRLIHGPVGGTAGGLLEVVDTTHGLFLVQDDERAIPTDAGAVRHLVRWLVGGGEVLVPLRQLPRDAALPVAAGREPPPGPLDGGTASRSTRPDSA